MKKRIVLLALICFFTVGAFAFNPAVGGETLYTLTSPVLLSNGISAVDGPFKNTGSYSIIGNPALTADIQRVMVDLSGTFLSSFGQGPDGTGGAFNAGLIVPSKWGVATGAVQGIFSSFDALDVGTIFTVRAGFSKDVLEIFQLGVALDGSFGSDWAANANLGFLHKIGNVAFAEDVRWGLSITGLGKPLSESMIGLESLEADGYPSQFTPRLGAAATLLNLSDFVLAASVDVSAPSFQNMVVDTGIGIRLFDMVVVNTNWNVNVKELSENIDILPPSIGVSVKFKINTGGRIDFVDSQGWQESEITPQIAYRSLHTDIQAISGGVQLGLGLEDTQAPVIKLGAE